MEYAQNGDLQTVLVSERDKHPAVNKWERRHNMALDIARGLKFLHNLAQPIVHRDLKSGNVLVDKNYCCKISDFGLAKMRDMTVSSFSRQGGGGTLAFSAPEVFSNTYSQKTVDEAAMKADVYSYAVILWQLKERKIPYDGVSGEVIRANVLSGDRLPLSKDDCSYSFTSLIVRCWHSQPAVRLSFSEIVTMIEGIKVQTVAPIASTGPTDNEIVSMVEGLELQTAEPKSFAVPANSDQIISHHNDQPNNGSIVEPQLDSKTVVDSEVPSATVHPSRTDQMPAQCKAGTSSTSSTPTNIIDARRDLDYPLYHQVAMVADSSTVKTVSSPVESSSTTVKNVISRVESELRSTRSEESPASPSKQTSPSELNDIQLKKVAEAVSGNWQAIGLHLGFSFQRIQDYKTAYPYSAKDRLLHILSDWRIEKGVDATAAALVEVCTEAKAGGAVKKVLGIK
jgi:serine/threonine protein kinase